MLNGMNMARDALAEYYIDDAPVMVMISASIAEAEEYDRAYELLFKEHGKLRAEAEGVRALTAQQAEDDGLWFDAVTAPEAYLQAALRRLHAVIETPNDKAQERGAGFIAPLPWSDGFDMTTRKAVAAAVRTEDGLVHFFPPPCRHHHTIHAMHRADDSGMRLIMARGVFIDSFSGALADLKKGQRTEGNALAVLAKHPRVSTWDMSECAWVRNLIGDLKRKELIAERADEPYPWHRYALTEAGRAAMTPNVELRGGPAASSPERPA